ncbi:metalloregulator ArsR/SmtB family transcription factor [Amycolatopsis sp. RM579]|uniref:Metalloregulator ArsR/SmtB family transcription factor n=1 Tax=Amycolatopsis pithecellobii TaxID=664692 RepID=A0A6N7ZBD6_9PSEU|nr:metalloregulator ArsR/SmtB family transcription factor [Amycolatopsis pithecellobii]MTD59081.1 metalloregulator ArsR/SmtB family transcription factor [Amycolatopsis pithecellobii]
MTGDADIARTATLFADPARVRVLMALADGRALAASVLANEAGLSAQGTSAHLAKLRDASLVVVERSGWHRFYRLAGPQVGEILETLAQIAPPQPVTSLKSGTRAEALRFARTCYDHLAGRLGVAVTAALVTHGALATTDGVPGTERREQDRLSAPLATHPYVLGPKAGPVFGDLGVDLDAVRRRRRPLLKFCLDWSEQRHHLAGALGAELAATFERRDWLEPRVPGHRAVRLTDTGRTQLQDRLDVRIPR